MADLVYGVSSFERQRGDFPALPVVNMLAESVPTEPGTALQSRPGLSSSGIDAGGGPVRKIFTADGVLGNGVFGVTGNEFFDGNTIAGGITGNGPVSMDAYSDYLFTNAGKEIYTYDGATLAPVAFPDSADVAKIVVAASRLVAIRKDTGTIYWSDPLGITIGALSFATAENSPDTLKDMLYIGDRLVLFGTETIETWPVTEDALLPFAPLVGAVLPTGIRDTGCASRFGRSFAWVTNNNEICVENSETVISEPELQVRIEASSLVSLWSFYVDNNEYLAIRLDGETWVYGARSQVWSKFETYGKTNWLAQCFDGIYFGSSEDGKLLQWDDDFQDDGLPISRSFRGWIPLTSDSATVSNVALRTNPGTTPYLTGSFADPTVELRTSRDGGRDWQPWKQRSLGAQGRYRTKTVWASLGQFSYPGALVEVRFTDPVDFRVSGLVYNEPFGGR